MTSSHTSSELWDSLVKRQADAEPLWVSESMSESMFQHEVVRFASQQGWLVHYDIPAHRHGMLRTQSGGDNGYPDLTLARNGVVLHVELKAQAGSFQANQKEWRDAIGASWRGWKPRDFAEIARTLE